MERIINKVKTDTNYYQWLYQAEPETARPLFDMWRDPTYAKLGEVVRMIVDLRDGLRNILINGNGIYDKPTHYWQGGVQMIRLLPYISQVLADSRLSVSDRAAVKSSAAFFAALLHDDDFVPFQKDANGGLLAGVNLGTANMPVEHQNFRDQFALL